MWLLVQPLRFCGGEWGLRRHGRQGSEAMVAAAKAAIPLKVWYKAARKAEWTTLVDVKNTFPATDHITADRLVFDVGGNKWRIVARVDYQPRMVFIRWVGDHKAYDKIDAATVSEAAMFDLQIIRDDATHEAALAEAERLMDISNRSDADTKRLELLGFLISRYEEDTLLGDLPDPIDAIEAMMETRGMTRRDLDAAFGNRATASLVLNRHRALSKEMIRRLADLLHLPESLLLQPYELVRDAG
jgi:mRNA-degrading endonuclease HigB of HigAB toxin-antitoxin module/antitoxin component HigA of HigAB toxin-antitoxin module